MCRRPTTTPYFVGRRSLETDGVFNDGFASQLATVAGSSEAGWTARPAMDVSRA